MRSMGVRQELGGRPRESCADHALRTPTQLSRGGAAPYRVAPTARAGKSPVPGSSPGTLTNGGLKVDIIGHWTVDGTPACNSPKTVGVTFVDFGRERPTYCVCSEADFRLMSAALLLKHPEARCEWHATRCPDYGRARDDDANCLEAEEY